MTLLNDKGGFAIRCGTGKPVPYGAILDWTGVYLRAYDAINLIKNLKQKSRNSLGQ